jgi:ADP-dependent phosphofructokinase/glucokinase
VALQERLELDLFKEITIPDLREKESKKKSTPADDAKKQAKIPLTLTNAKEITYMFAYEAEYEVFDKVKLASIPPRFKFIPPSREVVDRLIVRATMWKEDFY